MPAVECKRQLSLEPLKLEREPLISHVGKWDPAAFLVLNKAEAPVQFGVLLNFDRRGDVCEWHEHPLQNKGSVEQKSVFDWYRHCEHEEFHQRDVALYTSTPNTSTHLFGGRPPRLAASVKDAPSEKALALSDCKTRGGHKGIQTRKKNPPSLSMLTTPALTILFVSTLYIPFGSGVEFRPSFRPQFLRAGAPVLCKISSVIAETEG